MSSDMSFLLECCGTSTRGGAHDGLPKEGIAAPELAAIQRRPLLKARAEQRLRFDVKIWSCQAALTKFIMPGDAMRVSRSFTGCRVVAWTSISERSCSQRSQVLLTNQVLLVDPIINIHSYWARLRTAISKFKVGSIHVL